MKSKENFKNKNISRREAIIKTGKYAAVTATATFLILSPKQSQADSPADPGWGGNAEPSPSSKDEINKSYNG